MSSLTARSSTIFISTDAGTNVYRSVEEVPADLRRKLVQSTQSMNSATILIADKRGREELVRALQGRRNGIQCRLVNTIRSRQHPEAEAKPGKRASLRTPRTWLQFLLPLGIGASLWFLINTRF